jgi:hypothetical protein
MGNSVSSQFDYAFNLIKSPNIGEYKLHKFRAKLIERLAYTYSIHWYLERPQKGKGYQTIRKNNNSDAV